MPSVTICVPAYRAGSFLSHTLESALRQSDRDLEISVAIEPPGDEEAQICTAFQARGAPIRFVINERVLGWAGNIATMLRKIDSEFFLILPHDDFLHPDYVTTLRSALERDPSASVAYGDIQFMDGAGQWRRRQILVNAEPADRLASFWAAGGEAPVWRGLTRRSVLSAGDFPTDSFKGFLVECEWAYHLLCCGPAIRVPQTLYFKRMPAPGNTEDRATAIRAQTDLNTRLAALEDHRARVVSRTTSALGWVPPLTMAGIESVLARRYLDQGINSFPESVTQRIAAASSWCENDASPIARRIFSNLNLLEARRALAPADVRSWLDRALQADPDNDEAHVALARMQFDGGDIFGAVVSIARACDIAPYRDSSRDLSRKYEAAFLERVSEARQDE